MLLLSIEQFDNVVPVAERIVALAVSLQQVSPIVARVGFPALSS